MDQVEVRYLGLPAEGNAIGDTIKNDHNNKLYTWNGNDWDCIGDLGGQYDFDVGFNQETNELLVWIEDKNDREKWKLEKIPLDDLSDAFKAVYAKYLLMKTGENNEV